MAGWQDAPLASDAEPAWMSAPVEPPPVNPPHDKMPARQFAMTKGGPGAPNPAPLLSSDANNFIDTYLTTPARRAASDLLGMVGSSSQSADPTGIQNGTPLAGGPENAAFRYLTTGGLSVTGDQALKDRINQVNLPTVSDVRGSITGAGNDAPTAGGRVAQTAIEGGMDALPFGGGPIPMLMGGASGGGSQIAKEAGLSPGWQTAAGFLPLLVGGGVSAAKFGMKALGAANPVTQAKTAILAALTNDGLTPQQAQAKWANWQLSGSKPEALIDLGGDSMRRLGRALYTGSGGAAGPAGGPASTVEANLAGRGDDRALRLEQDYHDTARGGAPAPNIYDASGGITTAQQAAARPNYQAAYAATPISPDAMQPGGSIGSMLNRPSMRIAMKNALNIAAEKGVDPNSLGIDFNAAGEPVFKGVPSWQTLDFVKRGLDDVMETYRDKTTGKLNLDTYGRAAQDTLGQFRGILRDQNPAYAKALDDFSGPAQTLNALNNGRDFMSLDPEQVKAQLSKLGPADQDAYRLGVARTLRDQMGGAGGATRMNAAFGSGPRHANFKSLIAATFGDDATYQKFADRAARESNMAKNENFVLGGSQTANKTADAGAGALGREAFQAGKAGVASALSHNLAPLFMYLGDASGRLASRAKGITPEVAKILAPMMTNPGADVAGYLKMLAAMAEKPKPSFFNNYVAPIAPVNLRHSDNQGLLGVQ